MYIHYTCMHALKIYSITELKSCFSSINTHMLQSTCVHLRISKSCVDQVSNTKYSFNLQCRYIHAQVCKNNIPIFKILLSFTHEYICVEVPCTISNACLKNVKIVLLNVKCPFNLRIQCSTYVNWQI